MTVIGMAMVFSLLVGSIIGIIFGLCLSYLLFIKRKKDNLIKELEKLPYHARMIGSVLEIIKERL